MAFDIKAADVFPGTVRLDTSAKSIIGVGALKTAQSAQLTLSPLMLTGIGSGPNCEIVLKRPYIDDHPAEPGPPFTRYTLKDESNILYREANVLYWAKALLKMTYEFIDHAINGAKESPPFKIPRLHFVDAGLLLVYAYVPAGTLESVVPQSAKPSGTVSMMYLAEELISISLDKDFVKYIHNSDAAPCALLDPEEKYIAQFLTFTQHVQYTNTSGQVYISDYQGIFTSMFVI